MTPLLCSDMAQGGAGKLPLATVVCLQISNIICVIVCRADNLAITKVKVIRGHARSSWLEIVSVFQEHKCIELHCQSYSLVLLSPNISYCK